MTAERDPRLGFVPLRGCRLEKVSPAVFCRNAGGKLSFKIPWVDDRTYAFVGGGRRLISRHHNKQRAINPMFPYVIPSGGFAKL